MPKKPAKILIIDDDPEILKLLKIILRGDEFSLFSVQNGRLALAKIKEQHYDLLIVDRLMPRMDGISFIKKLRNDLKLEIPVILMSAHDQDEKTLNEISDLIYDIAPKPFNALRLRLTIRNALKYQKLQKKYITMIKTVIRNE
jgi:DNA-binding NtrC family response regulator